MAIGHDTYAYRRRLPHLSKAGRTYDVTFCTRQREVLPPCARTITLASCIHDHDRLAWLDCVTVMPDHVHLVITPYENASLIEILKAVKSASVHKINQVLGRSGSLWQRESFDRILRSEDKLQKKREYIFNNPVRAGLVDSWDEYPWTWFSR